MVRSVPPNKALVLLGDTKEDGPISGFKASRCGSSAKKMFQEFLGRTNSKVLILNHLLSRELI
nr:MAG TPA: hypothetical protein [Caudoviricetes sp.]